MIAPHELTRATGLARLAQTLPHLGHNYAVRRNTDAGPDKPTTSMLSPWLRRRLLTEQEVVAAALHEHGPMATKFVEEVFWRTYWKGHLQTRPDAWASYLQATALQPTADMARAIATAEAGRTGIDGFDQWAHQLTETGWLHNHARMWFASIWIFTLRLPWQHGAAFFLRHLIDGDPASNTLSWRWVAGLHTRGKLYVARAENIRRYTEGRFDPHGLDESPQPLPPDLPDQPDLPTALPPPAAPPAGDVALLLHLDDLHPESLPLSTARITRIAPLLAHAPDATQAVRALDRAAMDDALARAAAHFGTEAVALAEDWNHGLPILAATAPVGPSATALPPGTIQLRRAWDTMAWPQATRGFFRLRAAIPDILATLGLPSPQRH